MNKKITLFLIALIWIFKGYGQISSNANASVATEYSDQDKIFVFCTNDVNGGSLIANDSTSNGKYNFEWFRFNSTTNNFTDAISNYSINTDSTQSTITNLSTGGYKVVLTKPGSTQEYIAWVYINNELTLNLELYDRNSCNIVGVIANPYYTNFNSITTSLTYTDISTLETYNLRNHIRNFNWSSNTEPSIPNLNSSFFTTSNLPWENTTYSLVATDMFGCSINGSIEYTAIRPKADFAWKTVDEKGIIEEKSGDPDSDLSEQAPLSIQFTNESINAIKYRWDFGDSTRNDDQDTVYTDDIDLEPLHTYYYTNDTGKTYTMQLYCESQHGCKDSVDFSLKVLPTEIEFPNVFTPNGDTKNDFFKLTKYQSIQTFKITIFNRVGQVVHEYEGDVRDWEGWDGNVKNSNRESPAGTYFFIVEVKGWDNKKYNNDNIGSPKDEALTESTSNTDNGSKSSTKFGVLMLFRNKP
ncbi:MAG: gliding motility-associated C-terminal domain-containing protein [Bacteroidales bacterium]|nr:gliding motility-associated C-terminal domain-containing protein [Bacteroidales bacterium]